MEQVVRTEQETSSFTKKIGQHAAYRCWCKQHAWIMMCGESLEEHREL